MAIQMGSATSVNLLNVVKVVRFWLASKSLLIDIWSKFACWYNGSMPSTSSIFDKTVSLRHLCTASSSSDRWFRLTKLSSLDDLERWLKISSDRGEELQFIFVKLGVEIFLGVLMIFRCCSYTLPPQCSICFQKKKRKYDEKKNILEKYDQTLLAGITV